MRAALAPLGVATLAAAWLGAPEALLPGPFSAHMTMHMAVVAVAAPLIALGVAGGSLDPVRRWPRLFPVVPASIAELLLVWGWHTPALHHAARTSTLAFLCEQGSFLASGLWLWLAAVGGAAQRHATRDGVAPRAPGGLDRSGAGIIALLLTCMHMTLLGALLALPPRALYAHGSAGPDHAGHGHAGHGHAAQGEEVHGEPGQPSRMTPLDDQHLGGAIMIVLGGAAYLAGGLWLALGLVRERQRSLGAARVTPATGGRT